MKNPNVLHGSRFEPAQSPSAHRGSTEFCTQIAFGLSVPVWVYLAVLLVLAFAILTVRPAAGFSIDPSLTNGTPFDRSDDLLDAARWSDGAGSYVEHGVRGLGGGLEYSISPEFCARLIPRFIDSPSCDDLRRSVQQAFDVWAEENPKLRFVDVSGRVEAQLPPSWVADPWRGFGAEIDLLALSPDQFANVRGLGAWTQLWYLFADPLGTNGRVLPGNSITSADIIINSQACFYLDPESARSRCNNFGALLLHETGHIFGLGHSNDVDNGYFDTDDDPFNAMLIDCESPRRGLKLSSSADPQSVMNPGQRELGQARMELSEDELGAIRFLYPICFDAVDLSG